MSRDEMEVIGDKIDDLMLPLLLPARLEKRIEENVFQKLEVLLEELKKGMVNNQEISRKLVGKLFFIYVSLATEASYCNYEGELILKVGVLEEYLDAIFGVPDF